MRTPLHGVQYLEEPLPTPKETTFRETFCEFLRNGDGAEAKKHLDFKTGTCIAMGPPLYKHLDYEPGKAGYACPMGNQGLREEGVEAVQRTDLAAFWRVEPVACEMVDASPG